MRTFPKPIAIGAGVLLVLLALGAVGGLVWVQRAARASLPPLDGEVALPGLDAAVTVERDALGVPTIRGATRVDVARATGFVHAQERFFQMDLLRRSAAGELSGLIGPATLERDRLVRIHRFRAIAEANLAGSKPASRAVMEGYAAGVNQGLAALGGKPPEYLLLRSEPEPWRPEDTTLVVLAMYLDLQDETGRREHAIALMRDLLPSGLFDFLVGWGSEWDAPMIGEPLQAPSIPPAEVFDLRQQPRAVARAAGTWEALVAEAGLVGSNSWAVAGRRTRDGGGILANDMHLALGLPNIWFRVSLAWTDPDGTVRQITGVTLPGAPTIISGSNGRVAWGFTNSYGDFSDLVLLDGDARTYITPDGPREYELYEETIPVRGGPDDKIEVRWTIWGPVLDPDHRGRPRAVRWVAHDVEGVNLGLLDMERARDVGEALDVATRTRIPTQNCVVADRSGSIGWTLMGPIPRRRGVDGRWPVEWTDPAVGWDGYLAPTEYPRIVDPDDGIIWTANNRVVDLPLQRSLGDGGYAGGARARQIRDRLLELDAATPEDMLAIQLDDRALFLQRWRGLLLGVLTPDSVASDPRRAELRRLVDEDWPGRAAVDSAGYRMVRAYRLFLAEQVFDPLTAACRAVDETFDYRSFARWEGPLWRLVTERPPHLLDPQWPDWNAQLLAAADATLDYFAEQEGATLSEQTWGKLNTVRLRHPLSLAVPALGRWLDIEARQIPGDSHMPRVQGAGFGASERLAVSPGREDSGLFHMPGGQSGHPLSPTYRAGHETWVEGLSAPLIPGATTHTLTLLPE